MYWNFARFKSIYIFMSGHFHALSMRKPHFQRNANWKVPTTSPRFCNEPHLLHVLFVKVAAGTTFTSWSKHHFVVIANVEQQVCKAFHCCIAPSNNKDPTSWLFYLCLFAPHGCRSSRTSRSWWIAHAPQR